MVFGSFNLPEVVDVVQTNVPVIQVNDRTLDVNFVLADGMLLHIEFEASDPTEDNHLGSYLIGAMVAVNYGWIEEPGKSKILGVLRMLQPFQELYQEFREEGMERGETTKALEVARKMLAMNMNTETIKEIIGLPLAEILKLMH